MLAWKSRNFTIGLLVTASLSYNMLELYEEIFLELPTENNLAGKKPQLGGGGLSLVLWDESQLYCLLVLGP